MIRFTGSIVLAVFRLIEPVSAWQDYDLHCSNGQYFSRFWRKNDTGRLTMGGKCSPFWPSINQDISCSLGPTLTCMDDWEGCDDPHGWIGGFQIFQADYNTEIYSPYCCTSTQVRVDKSHCRAVDLVQNPNQYFDRSVENGHLFSYFRCNYIQSNYHKTIDQTTMAIQECPYSIAADTTAPITQKSIDPSLCFQRFISKNRAIDFVEENVLVISTVSVENEHECAAQCIQSDPTCNSYRFLTQGDSITCALRRNYVHGEKTHISKLPINVAYGNRTGECDAIET